MGERAVVADVIGGQLILDTGGLLAYAEQDRRARAAIAQATDRNFRVVIPAVVLTQCIRGGPRDAPINRVIRALNRSGGNSGNVLPITEERARQAGILLAAFSGQQGVERRDQPDAVDAIVVATALWRLPAAIRTSDPTHIRQLIDAAPERGRVQVIAI